MDDILIGFHFKKIISLGTEVSYIVRVTKNSNLFWLDLNLDGNHPLDTRKTAMAVPRNGKVHSCKTF